MASELRTFLADAADHRDLHVTLPLNGTSAPSRPSGSSPSCAALMQAFHREARSMSANLGEVWIAVSTTRTKRSTGI